MLFPTIYSNDVDKIGALIGRLLVSICVFFFAYEVMNDLFMSAWFHNLFQ